MERIIRTELAYYRDTHKTEIAYNPDLFKLNRISHEERTMNLCALLNNEDLGRKYLSLPTNKDAEAVLSSMTEKEPEAPREISGPNDGELCVTLWTENKRRTWYLGYCVNHNSDKTYSVEHLHRVSKGSQLRWKHPPQQDIAEVSIDQILECVIEGDWDVSKERMMSYSLKNHKYIDQLVSKL